jgi:hypothetical protein
MWSFSAPERLPRPPATAPYDGDEPLTRRTRDGKNGQADDHGRRQHSDHGNATTRPKKGTS